MSTKRLFCWFLKISSTQLNDIYSQCVLMCMTICDWIYENHPYLHILCFRKYRFETLKQLWFSCASLQPHQICCISRAVLRMATVFIANSAIQHLLLVFEIDFVMSQGVMLRGWVGGKGEGWWGWRWAGKP